METIVVLTCAVLCMSSVATVYFLSRMSGALDEMCWDMADLDIPPVNEWVRMRGNKEC